ncbi:hypothetical protein E2C01_093822 [Portunus trituberculatus]|uniref:Uncharacterized protein n=1 Tax=Portunus trituberculatus TaxID=210409 RepID=A0A5B7JK55_PORTR|nr:hypothetical protein [Portunus trituberculatus]
MGDTHQYIARGEYGQRGCEMGKDDLFCGNICLKAQGGVLRKLPDISTCPRTNSERERIKHLAWKYSDFLNDPRLSAHDAAIIPKQPLYVKG